jgi:iron complex transport system substrate-binding protein
MKKIFIKISRFLRSAKQINLFCTCLTKKLFFLFILTAFAVQGQPYTRIVSLAPSFTQSLYYLGAQDNLVGCTSYCEVAKGDNKEIVSSAVKANVEKIISLKPDLVLASGLTNPKDTELLRKVGIKVEIIHSPKSFQEICEQFIRMGALVGKTEKANTLVEESKRTIQRITEKNKQNTNRKMLFQIGANPLFAVIPNTFMDDYMTLLGIENIAGKLTQGTVTREFVIANNPDYIFIATMGIAGEEELKTWSRYSSLKAAKNKQIYIIDSDIACQPTPITFAQTMEVIDQLMEGSRAKTVR